MRKEHLFEDIDQCGPQHIISGLGGNAKDLDDILQYLLKGRVCKL